jgi:hypothetical protein
MSDGDASSRAASQHARTTSMATRSMLDSSLVSQRQRADAPGRAAPHAGVGYDNRPSRCVTDLSSVSPRDDTVTPPWVTVTDIAAGCGVRYPRRSTSRRPTTPTVQPLAPSRVPDRHANELCALVTQHRRPHVTPVAPTGSKSDAAGHAKLELPGRVAPDLFDVPKIDDDGAVDPNERPRIESRRDRS